MAPRKRKPEEPQQPAKAETLPTRVTRSMAHRLTSDSVALVKAADDSPKNKQNKATGNKKQKKEEQAKTEPDKQKAEEEEDKKRTIVIEHCKQCRSFKTRADQVKEGLENDLEGITVLLNPEKPRRGCFEIREEGGRTFISLLNMKRPFKPMKDLDMSKVILDIIDKIKE